MDAPPQADDFDVAKAVSEKLRGIEKERQERILRWVAEGLGLSFAAPSVAPATSVGGIGPGDAGRPAGGGSDIKSFVAAKAPKSDNQFAATVAYYYRFEAQPSARRDFITGEVLQEAARLSGRDRFTEPRKTLNNAKQAGYLDGGAPGEFSINSVGENLVAMALPGGVEGSGGSSKSPRKKKRKGRR